MLHFEDSSLSDYYFLSPQWLCDMLAHIVTIEATNACISANGKCVHLLLFNLYGEKYSMMTSCIERFWLLCNPVLPPQALLDMILHSASPSVFCALQLILEISLQSQAILSDLFRSSISKRSHTHTLEDDICVVVLHVCF